MPRHNGHTPPKRPRRVPYPEDRSPEYLPRETAFHYVKPPEPATPPVEDVQAVEPTPAPVPTRTLPGPSALVPLTRADLAGLLGALGAHTPAHLDHAQAQEAHLLAALTSGRLKRTGRGAARKLLKTTGLSRGLGIGECHRVDTALVAYRVTSGEAHAPRTDHAAS